LDGAVGTISFAYTAHILHHAIIARPDAWLNHMPKTLGLELCGGKLTHAGQYDNARCRILNGPMPKSIYFHAILSY
jgi:hypothetical protein